MAPPRKLSVADAMFLFSRFGVFIIGNIGDVHVGDDMHAHDEDIHNDIRIVVGTLEELGLVRLVGVDVSPAPT